MLPQGFVATRPLPLAVERATEVDGEQRYLRLVTRLLRFEAPGSVVLKP